MKLTRVTTATGLFLHPAKPKYLFPLCFIIRYFNRAKVTKRMITKKLFRTKNSITCITQSRKYIVLFVQALI